jgi:hypothetical protein
VTSRVVIGAGAAITGLIIMVVIVFLAIAGGSSSATVTTTSGSEPSAPSGAVAKGVSATVNEQIGAQLAARRGWTGSQDTCLNELWTRESGWNNIARNASSGAYGIAQSLGHLPGESAATAGYVALNREGYNYPQTAANPPGGQFGGTSDPATQITWGLGYIQATYGSPCAAWAHETTAGWY